MKEYDDGGRSIGGGSREASTEGGASAEPVRPGGDGGPVGAPRSGGGARIALIDLGSIFVAAWFASGADQDADAPHDITVRRVHRIAADFDHVAVCCDTPPYDRAQIDPAYKANRKATPDEVAMREARTVQLGRVAETLRRDGFAVYAVRGLEADDLIATLVGQAPAGSMVTIWSSDKDLMQLVGPDVVLQSPKLDPEKGLPPVIGVDGVVARWGVTPNKLAEVLALTGDGSDNIPGVRGIGPKKAAPIVELYGTVELAVMMARNDDPEMKPALKALLVEHGDRALTSRRLVELVRTAPVDIADALKPRVPMARPPVEVTCPEGDPDPMSVTEAEFEPAKNDHAQPPASEDPKDPPPPAPPPPQQSTTRTLSRVEPGGDIWAVQLEPNNLATVEWLSKVLHDSLMFSGYPTWESCLAAMIQGRELGIPALAALRLTHPMDVKGKRVLAMSAQFIMGLVHKSGRADVYKCIETTETRCRWKGHRRDDADPDPMIVEYTIEKAKKAGVWRAGGPWDTRPEDMLYKTAGVILARRLVPDVVGGLYFPEELVDAEHEERRAA